MLKEWIRLSRVRPHYAIAILCGAAVAQNLSPLPILLVFVLIYGALFYGVFVNFIHDFRGDTNNPTMRRYAHLQGRISQKELKTASLICQVTVIFSGIALFYVQRNAVVLLLTTWALFCGYSYSVPPLRLKRFWWGGTVSYTLSATVAFLTSAVALGASSLMYLGLTSMVFWLGSLSAWALTHLSDVQADRAIAITTPAIKFGAKKCHLLSVVLMIGSSCVAALISVYLLHNLWAAIAFALTATLAAILNRKVFDGMGPERLRVATHTLGVVPYWLNILFLTAFYLL